MSTYTYYVFTSHNGRDAQPVHTGTRESMDTRATEFGRDNGYYAAIGPFRTRRGAEFMARHGVNNPHCQTVNDAERLAKQ